jgi:hypothetical protein
MDPRTTVTDYYESLRTGDPLGPYFPDEGSKEEMFVKFGLSERLEGSEAIREGLRTQTETTADWAVDSNALQVCERDRCAWFSDQVWMAWTDTDVGVRYEFDTRWSGTLVVAADGWQFVGMHVSTADPL